MERLTTKLLLSDSTRWGESFLTKLKLQGYDCVSLDGLDMSSSFTLDQSFQADLVMHTAERVPFQEPALASEGDYFQSNVMATQHLCAAIDQWEVKPKAFIFISSVCVYGANQGVLINENHPLSGKSAYARSKIAAEDFLIEWAYQHSITLSILRLPVWTISTQPNELFKYQVNAMKAGKYIRVGNARRSMLWTEDIVDLLAKVPQIEGIYNLTDGQHPSTKELEQVIREKLHLKKSTSIPLVIARPLAWLGDWIGRPFTLRSIKVDEAAATLTFDDQKARNQFNWNPSLVLKKIADSSH